MSRRHLYVMDPFARVHPAKDTTFDFLLEGQARSYENLFCEIHDLASRGNRGFAIARPVRVRRPTDGDPSYFSLGEPREVAFDDVDVIWMRKDPPVDEAFLQATMILDRHDPARTLVLNRPEGLRVANEKLFALFAADLFPHTVVSARRDVLRAEVERLGKAVLKPLSFAGGAGVLVFERGDRNLGSALDLLTDEGKKPALVQEYLPEVREGDKRVILLGGEPIGAVLRVPPDEDHRANLHIGGRPVRAEVDDRDREICARLAPALLRHGLHFVGIDVIGNKLTEVNVTSPTGVQEIDALDGRTGKERCSARVMDYVEALLARR